MVKKVLIVEDDKDIRLGLGVLLGREFKTFCCEDGVSAMAAIRRERPDAVILDIGLPGGDGLKLLEWLRDLLEFEDMTRIVVTGRDGEEVERQAMDLGAVRVFRKPADPQELINEVRLATEPRERRKRVLIVEDDADTRRGLVARLRANDIATTCAADGVAALSTARRVQPDAIVLDLGLPAGDGITVLQRLKGIAGLSHVPVIVLTGQDSDDTMERAVAAGASVYLRKPANGLEVMDAIGAVI